MSSRASLPKKIHGPGRYSCSWNACCRKTGREKTSWNAGFGFQMTSVRPKALSAGIQSVWLKSGMNASRVILRSCPGRTVKR